MSATLWNHLPNKKYIAQVLVDLKNHPDLFARVWDQAQDQAYIQAWVQAREQVRDQACSQAWDQAWDKSRHNTYYVARTALLSLIAYDDASKYLIMPVDQAIVYGELVSDSQYILLKQYLQVKQKIAELVTA
jgi:hypothetical protein